MGKRIALNVFYNLAIFVAILIGYSALEHKRYEYLFGLVFIVAILVILKIKLIKEIRNTPKKP
jgi:phosphotransferase system  glucose/maltose/N-acetylglucosamine-specific IIC component